jgi:hypothetical protein
MITLISNTSKAGTLDTVTTDAIDTSGANLIVVGLSYNNGSTPVLTDNKGNSYTALTAQAVSANGVSRLYYCVSPNVGSGHTFTNAVAGNYCSICVEAFSGVKVAVPFDRQNGANNAAASSLATGNVIPNANNEVIVTHFMFSVAATASIDGGFTLTNQTNFGTGVNYGGAMAYLIQTAATSANPNWSEDGGATGIAATIATFRFRADNLTSSVLRPSIFVPGIGK